MATFSGVGAKIANFFSEGWKSFRDLCTMGNPFIRKETKERIVSQRGFDDGIGRSSFAIKLKQEATQPYVSGKVLNTAVPSLPSGARLADALSHSKSNPSFDKQQETLISAKRPAVSSPVIIQPQSQEDSTNSRRYSASS